MSSVSGLTVLPPDHIIHHYEVSKVFNLNVNPKAVQDIPHSGRGFTIVDVRSNSDHLELDIGYTYGGGEGPAIKVYSDLQRSNSEVPEVHVYLERETPPDMRVKGMFCKDTVRLPLNNPCFLAPVSIHLHHIEDYNRMTGRQDNKDIVFKRT